MVCWPWACGEGENHGGECRVEQAAYLTVIRK
jgi:hypothetical protein